MLYVGLTAVELGSAVQIQNIGEGFFHPAPPPQTWRTRRLTTPTGTSAHDNEKHEMFSANWQPLVPKYNWVKWQWAGFTNHNKHRSFVPIHRLHPPKCVFVGRLRYGDATKAVPIQRPRPTNTSFVGRLRHGGAAKTVPIHDASSEGCIPRPIASSRQDEAGAIRKRHQMHPFPGKWRIHQMDTSQPTLSQNSQHAGDKGTFIQTK